MGDLSSSICASSDCELDEAELVTDDIDINADMLLFSELSADSSSLNARDPMPSFINSKVIIVAGVVRNSVLESLCCYSEVESIAESTANNSWQRVLSFLNLFSV